MLATKTLMMPTITAPFRRVALPNIALFGGSSQPSVNDYLYYIETNRGSPDHLRAVLRAAESNRLFAEGLTGSSALRAYALGTVLDEARGYKNGVDVTAAKIGIAPRSKSRMAWSEKDRFGLFARAAKILFPGLSVSDVMRQRARLIRTGEATPRPRPKH